MKQRKIGELEVSSIGMGCMGMSSAYGGLEEKEAIYILHQAVELGINFFDTAEVYGPFANEQLLQKAFKDYKDIFIATKFGFQLDPSKEGIKQVCGLDSHPKNIRKIAEESLKRLGRETIDLFYQHRVDPTVPIEDVVGTMADLIHEGKIQHIGLCEVSANTLRKAHAVHPITAVQSEYSLWSREAEQKILPTCTALNIGFVPYSPLGRGFLTGQLQIENLGENDFRKNLPRFQKTAVEQNHYLIQQLEQISQFYHCSNAQLALAWMLHKYAHLVPIPGIRRMNHLQDNIATSDITIEQEHIQKIDEIFLPENIAGARYNEQELQMIDI